MAFQEFLSGMWSPIKDVVSVLYAITVPNQEKSLLFLQIILKNKAEKIFVLF